MRPVMGVNVVVDSAVAVVVVGVVVVLDVVVVVVVVVFGLRGGGTFGAKVGWGD